MSYTRYTTPDYVPGESTRRSPEYAAWANMMTRCRNKKRACWHNYGGRGVLVVQRWYKYKNFLADMGRMPAPSMCLDRINGDRNYSKENCAWVSRAHNSTHTRRVRTLTAFGEAKTYAEWSRDCRCPSVAPLRIYGRVWRGWDPELAITTPTKQL